MPFDGEKLDELLSGFIDQELSPSELREVEEAIAADARLREQITLLRQQSQELRACGKRLAAANRLPIGFAERVVLAVQGESVAAAGDAAPTSSSGAAYLASPAGMQAAARSSRFRKRVLIGSWLAALAASVMLVIFLSQDAERGVPAGDPLVNLDSDADSSSESAQFVGDVEIDANFTYVLVVDVRLTRSAWERDALGDILSGSGILPSRPILASRAARATLDQSRMLVQPHSQKAEDTVLYVIQADMKALDSALRHVWSDSGSFPNVSFDVAIDTRTELVREILKSMTHFPLTSTFAAPVVLESSSLGASPSPFPGSTQGVRYVSSSNRARGWNAGAEAVAQPDSMATILLVGRIVE